jgi:hypothetical protein
MTIAMRPQKVLSIRLCRGSKYEFARFVRQGTIVVQRGVFGEREEVNPSGHTLANRTGNNIFWGCPRMAIESTGYE